MSDYDNPALYDLAKRICLRMGLPWTDPRTGETHKPMKTIDITKETKRRARQSVGPVPKTKVIRDKRRKKPKHREKNDVSTD